jgi:hypothetical protein
MPHPNSLANLRPWKPGERPPSPGPGKIEQALKVAKDACPKAVRLIARTIDDPEVPLPLRIRCAEYIADKVLPSQNTSQSLQIGQGVEWLELRFVAPSGTAAPETHRIPFDPVIDVANDETKDVG